MMDPSSTKLLEVKPTTVLHDKIINTLGINIGRH